MTKHTASVAAVNWEPARFETLFLRHLERELQGTRFGRLIEVVGNQVKVAGIALRIGQMCALSQPEWRHEVLAEVVGVASDGAVLTLLGDVSGLSAATLVLAQEEHHCVGVGSELLGRVLDGLGNPIDNHAAPVGLVPRVSAAAPPHPLSRPLIRTVLYTGIRAIDGFLTAGRGQRFGIFAPAGVGKSTLLGMIAKGAPNCICVVALIGERGREVREFLEATLTPQQLENTVIVVATSDRPSMERIKAAYTATTIAEHFRDLGQDVLLLFDSVTRFARALRETGLAAGEQPVRRGYPPSVFTALPKLVERAGPAAVGSITAFYTVLLEDAEMVDPIGEEIRSLLDGHIVLSQKLAGAGHYPAIDIRQSVSRLMPQLVDRDTLRVAAKCRDWLVKYEDAELLLQVGEYQQGTDRELDSAIEARPDLVNFLQQGEDEHDTSDEVLSKLGAIVRTHLST
jgi:type III secretion protein N (ATPase)